MNHRLNGFLLILFLITIGLILLVDSDPSLPNVEFLPNMKHSPAFDAYEENPNFINGKTLQAPVEGTLAIGEKVFRYGSTPEEAIRAGKELTSPIPAGDKDALARGGILYRRTCASCHGPTGLGDGPVAKRGYPPPPSFKGGKLRDLKDGQLFHVITYGQGNMEPFGVQFTPMDRWRIITYLRTLQ